MTPATSELLIPSVRGEYYNYTARFSTVRPLYCLIKCKANKDWQLSDVESVVNEIDVVFVFGATVQVCSPNSTASLLNPLGDIFIHEELNSTKIARANITAERFCQLREQKDGPTLAEVCRKSVAQNDEVVDLNEGAVIAMVTASGKYGLFLVRELTPSSLKIHACHILL
jgi:hypothetical protein